MLQTCSAGSHGFFISARLILEPQPRGLVAAQQRKGDVCLLQCAVQGLARRYRRWTPISGLRLGTEAGQARWPAVVYHLKESSFVWHKRPAQRRSSKSSEPSFGTGHA